MNFLSAQSDNDYNIWQLRVQMHNFSKFGIEDKAVILIGYNPNLGVSRKALEFKNLTSAMVLFLPDQRDLSNRLYTPSIRPHLIKQIYNEYPKLLENRAILYHDCDIIFIKLPHVKDLIVKRKIFVSDLSMFPTPIFDSILLKEMYRIVGIPSSMVNRHEEGFGGAQYLFNSSLNFSYDFWEKVEYDCNNIYKLLLVSSEKYGGEIIPHAWSADMWALLWNIWLLGVDTEINQELSFCVASSPISELDNVNIYHNTGVDLMNRDKLFYKRDFIKKSPFNVNLSYVSKEHCSIFYANEIIETAEYHKEE